MDLRADYVTVIEDRSIMSVKYCLPVLVFTFGQNWRRTTQSLCYSWASCFFIRV